MRSYSLIHAHQDAATTPASPAPGKTTRTAGLPRGARQHATIGFEADAAPSVTGDDPFWFGGASVEDVERRLERIVVNVEERMTIAEVDMGKRGEASVIAGHGHDVAVLLAEANRLVGDLDGGAATPLVPLIKRLDPPIEMLYAWARNARVAQGVAELDRVFDRWDRLRLAVGLDEQRRARTYYADWSVEGHLADGQYEGADPTQRDLVDDCVRMFELDSVIAPAMAIEQFETMLEEPPMPPEGPGFLDRMLGAAVTMVLGLIPGKLGGAVAAVLGDDEPALVKVIAGFTEQAAGVIIGEATAADEAVAEGQIKTSYLDRIRLGALGAMRQTGAAVGSYRGALERKPPQEIARLHRELQRVPAALWNRLKQDIVMQWVNFKASLPHGFVEGGSGALDLGRDARDGESWQETAARTSNRQGFIQAHVFVGRDGLEQSLSASAEPAVVRELAKGGLAFMHMPMHRTVRAWRAIAGSSKPWATIYLSAAGGVELEDVDHYIAARFADGGSMIAPWEDGEVHHEERERAEHAPAAGDVMRGIYKLLGSITLTSADLR